MPHNCLVFLPEKVKIGKFGEHFCNWNDKKLYVIHAKNLKQDLNDSSLLEKIKLNQIQSKSLPKINKIFSNY